MQLRPFQEKSLKTLEQKSSHLIVIAPTGSGKSLIFEMEAQKWGMRTLLITPLIALARQQHEKFVALGVHSVLGSGGSGSGPPVQKINHFPSAWVISPEKLFGPDKDHTLRLLQTWNPNFLVVDECHCLWEWGREFRPAYMELPRLFAMLQLERSLWLSATLPFDARMFLRSFLPQPQVEIGSFEFPQRISFQVQEMPWSERLGFLYFFLQENSDFGIIFVHTRRWAEKLCKMISNYERKVTFYHAGLSTEERQNLEKQVSEKSVRVVVSTSAFGLGMDFDHLGWVLIWQVPTSITTLAQMIGRVGRGTQKGRAWALWSEEDFQLLEWTLKESHARIHSLQSLYELYSTEAGQVSIFEAYFNGVISKSVQVTESREVAPVH